MNFYLIIPLFLMLFSGNAKRLFQNNRISKVQNTKDLISACRYFINPYPGPKEIKDFEKKISDNKIIDYISQHKDNDKMVNLFIEVIKKRTLTFDNFIKKNSKNVDYLIIIGSGSDLRAYRLDELKDVNVVEVDFPEVLDYKKNMVENIPLKCKSITYQENNLKKKDLFLKIQEKYPGPKIWLLEGITYYLDDDVQTDLLNNIRQDMDKYKNSRLLIEYGIVSNKDIQNNFEIKNLNNPLLISDSVEMFIKKKPEEFLKLNNFKIEKSILNYSNKLIECS